MAEGCATVFGAVWVGDEIVVATVLALGDGLLTTSGAA
jgi:hypothetical protein